MLHILATGIFWEKITGMKKSKLMKSTEECRLHPLFVCVFKKIKIEMNINEGFRNTEIIQINIAV